MYISEEGSLMRLVRNAFAKGIATLGIGFSDRIVVNRGSETPHGESSAPKILPPATRCRDQGENHLGARIGSNMG